jgi:CHAT domain-containing protein
MVPRRRKAPPLRGFERRDPLGVEFAVGRWVHKEHRAGPIRVQLTEAYVLAPDYRDPDIKLPEAQSEARYVCDNFNGALVDPSSSRRLDETLRDQPRPLVHFVGHGATTDERGEAEDRWHDPVARAAQIGQVLTLQNDDGVERLTLAQLSGLAGVESGVAEGEPLIFLNACEVGRSVPSLSGLGGFAEAFTEMGATAVIAPLWSVEDELAHEVARRFYDCVRTRPDCRPSEVLREIRADAYRLGRDTYAAYALFGDPLLTCTAGS